MSQTPPQSNHTTDELVEVRDCGRIALMDQLMYRYATDYGFGIIELRKAVEPADDIDEEITPVAWGDCKDYSQTDNVAIVVAGTAGAANASPIVASCAGAATVGGVGGGAC